MLSRDRGALRTKQNLVQSWMKQKKLDSGRKEEEEELPDFDNEVMEDAEIAEMEPEKQWTLLEETEEKIKQLDIAPEFQLQFEKAVNGSEAKEEDLSTDENTEKKILAFSEEQIQAQKNLEKIHADQQALKKAELEMEVAKKKLEELKAKVPAPRMASKQKESTAGSKLELPDLRDEDFAELTDQEEEKAWDASTQKEQTQRAQRAAQTALEMVQEMAAAKMVRIICFLPYGWQPQWLSSELLRYKGMGFLHKDMGFVAMAEKSTPASIYIDSHAAAGAVQSILSWASGGAIKSIVDHPSEISQQNAQFKDVLRWMTEQVKMNRGRERQQEDLSSIFMVARPKRRLRSDEESKNDWWSIAIWSKESDKQATVAVTCEYNHKRMRQTFVLSKKILRLLKISRTEMEDQLQKIHQYYRWFADIVEADVAPAHELKAMGFDNDDKKKEDVPPPPKALGDTQEPKTVKAEEQEDAWTTFLKEKNGDKGGGKGSSKGKKNGEKGGGKGFGKNYQKTKGWSGKGWNSKGKSWNWW